MTLKDTYNLIQNILDQEEIKANLLYNNYTGKLITKLEEYKDKFFNANGPGSIFSSVSNITSKIYEKCAKSYDPKPFQPSLPTIIIPLPILPFLQLRIFPSVYLKYGFNFNCMNEKFEIGAFLYLYVQAEVSLNLEIGFYVPGANSLVEISISVGLKGVLGAGKVGLKLEYNLNQNHLAINLDYKFEALTLYFYIVFRITINLIYDKYVFEFYIVNQRICGLYKEYHKEIIYKFLK